jgi:phosphoglycerate dehydrogenase-like enzyme
MTDASPIVVLREGTEGLPTAPYAEKLRERLPDHDVRLARTPAAERELVVEAPVVTGVGIDEELLGRARELRLFACAFAGTDHLPMDALARHDVAVTNASGIHAPGVAEQAIGSMLVFARRLHEAWERKRRREWRHFQSSDLAGSRVTVVGMGAIGAALLRRLDGFDVETVGVRNTPQKGGPADRVIGFETEQFHDALATTDYLVLACPLTETTRGLIGPAAFATLPPSAVLVNVARGPIVETEALVDALRTQGIHGAALDVTDPEPLPEDHPLWGLENVLITPHTGGHTPEHWPRLADIVAENVRRLETGRVSDLRNLVSAPAGDGHDSPTEAE